MTAQADTPPVTDGPIGSPIPFKLRYASHLGVRSTDTPWFRETLGTLDPVAHIEYAAAMGFAGIEDNLLKTRPATDQMRIGEALARTGLKLGCMVGSMALDVYHWTLPDAGAAAWVDAEMTGAIEAAKRAGGKYLAIIPARHPSLPFGYQLGALIDHLRRVAPMAHAAGMVLTLEQTAPARVPNALLHQIADVHALVRAIDHPAVRMHFDFYHVQAAQGDLIGHLERCWDDIAFLQIADFPNRRELGDSELNWPFLLRWVRDRGYRGLVELEIIASREGVDGEQHALAMLRHFDALI